MKAKWLLLGSFAVVFILYGAIQVHEANATTTRNFTLYASIVQGGWSFTTTINDTTKNPTILVEQGDLVNLTLISLDGNTHEFFVSYANSSSLQTGDPISLPFSSSTNFQFNASLTIGTYTYYCYYHPLTLHGYFQVVPTGTIPEFQPLIMLSILLGSTIIVALTHKRRKQIH